MNRKNTLITIFISLLCSCKEIEKKMPVPTVSENGIEYYFPVQTDSLKEKPFVFQEKKLIPDFNILYSSVLKNMKEPNFLKKEDSGFYLRYTVLPAFGSPYSYRIQKNFNNWVLHYKILEMDHELNNFPYYEKDSLIKDTIISVSWHNFYQLEHKINLFDIEKRPTHNEFGLDGEFHIFEIYKDRKQEFIHRWLPRREDEAEFMDICAMIEDIYIGKLE